MVAILKRDMREFDRPPKSNRADQLLLRLMYLREYRTQFHIGAAYGVSEATACRTIQKVEDTLMQSGEFSLPGKKKLQESDTEIEVIIVDVAEQPIERPKKNKRTPIAVKKKRHTQKAQVIVNKETAEIIATDFGKGSVHDFRLFKSSRIGIVAEMECLADSGYQGLAELHENSQTPKKKSKHHPLTSTQKKQVIVSYPANEF